MVDITEEINKTQMNLTNLTKYDEGEKITQNYLRNGQ